MGVPTLEVGYTSATTGRGDHEVHKETCGGIGKKTNTIIQRFGGFYCLHLQGILKSRISKERNYQYYCENILSLTALGVISLRIH
jgi:hypothetical protein